MIDTPKEQGGLGIPLITLLLEGGTDAIYEIKDNLGLGQPCVVVDGSGRAADILAYAHNHATKGSGANAGYTMKQGHLKRIEQMLEESFSDRLKGEVGQERKKTAVNWIIECIHHADLITVFDIRTETNLDYKILSALLKGNSLNLYAQLFLAMVWNRVDIAEEKIFSNRNFHMKVEALEEVMIRALLMDRKDFVELLILNGFSMADFLTVKNLRELYNQGLHSWPELLEQIKKFVGSRSSLHLRDIHKYIKFILSSHKHPQYELDVTPSKKMHEELTKNSAKTFDDPYFELFVWTLLLNKPQLKEFFWKKCTSPLISCILGGAFYRLLKDYYRLSYNSDILAKLAEDMEDRANAILQIANAKDRNKAVSLVEKSYNRFGGRSLIRIAFIGKQRSFIANPTCQQAVSDTWKRGFSRLNPIAATFALFCPLLVLTPLFSYLPLGDDGGSLSSFQKMFVFYKAPMVKFIGNVCSYFVFLLLYAYVAIFNFTWRTQYSEIALYAWIVINMLDELREILIQPSSKFFRKLVAHYDNVYNALDGLVFLLAVTSAVLKQFSGTFMISRAIFAVNAVLLFIRLLRVYHVNINLGPKLVIFYRCYFSSYH